MLSIVLLGDCLECRFWMSLWWVSFCWVLRQVAFLNDVLVSVIFLCYYAECHLWMSICWMSSLNVIMLSVILLSVMPSVVSECHFKMYLCRMSCLDPLSWVSCFLTFCWLSSVITLHVVALLGLAFLRIFFPFVVKVLSQNIRILKIFVFKRTAHRHKNRLLVLSLIQKFDNLTFNNLPRNL